jgi:hypothetical protein
MEALSWLRVETAEGRSAFRPGDAAEGTVSWRLERAPAAVELRLFWYTEGKGDRDVEIAAAVPFAEPGAEDRRAFQVRLPEAPYSFSGKLISVIWALEVVAEPGGETGRLEITVSPTGMEVLLHPHAVVADARPG